MFELIFFLGFLLVAFFSGTIIEKKHYESIHREERQYLRLPVVSAKEVTYLKNIEQADLVSGSVVISLDHFKRFLAGLRNFFGGRVRSYESLLDRGRREALIRLKKNAKQIGFGLVLNLRFETTSVGQVVPSKNQSIGCFEVLAYGTGVKLKQ